MRIRGTEDIKFENTIVTVGKFDCFHLGHQLLFKTGASLKEDGMEQVIFMFDVNPRDVVQNISGRYIVARSERKDLSRSYGIDHCVEYPFNDTTRNMSPETFVKEILVDKFGVRAVVAGDDFRFGHNRSGDADTLVRLGEKYGFDVKIMNRLTYKGEVISSTLIRDRLLEGNLTDVNAMLGRPYSISGEIRGGKHIGSRMGIPTINIIPPEDKLLPPFGVYAVKADIDGTEYNGICNLGKRPTFYDVSDIVLETYIFDLDKDLYGRFAKINFYKFVRPEKKFSSAEKLYGQIEKDISFSIETLKKYC